MLPPPQAFQYVIGLCGPLRLLGAAPLCTEECDKGGKTASLRKVRNTATVYKNNNIFTSIWFRYVSCYMQRDQADLKCLLFIRKFYFFCLYFCGSKNFKMYTALAKNYLSHILLSLKLTSFLNTAVIGV